MDASELAAQSCQNPKRLVEVAHVVEFQKNGPNLRRFGRNRSNLAEVDQRWRHRQALRLADNCTTPKIYTSLFRLLEMVITLRLQACPCTVETCGMLQGVCGHPIAGAPDSELGDNSFDIFGIMRGGHGWTLH